MVMSGFERHLHNKVWFTYGACVRVVYSLNSLSCMVKYGLKSLQYFNGEMQLQGKRDKLARVQRKISRKKQANLKFVLCYVQIKWSCTQLQSKTTHLAVGWEAPLHVPDKRQHGFWRFRWWRCHHDERLSQQYQLPKHLNVKEHWTETPTNTLKYFNTLNITRINMYLIKNWINRTFIWKIENTLVKWHI